MVREGLGWPSEEDHLPEFSQHGCCAKEGSLPTCVAEASLPGLLLQHLSLALPSRRLTLSPGWGRTGLSAVPRGAVREFRTRASTAFVARLQDGRI